MDFTSAYEVPELRKLTRTFVYSRRKEGSLAVSDEVEFSGPHSFETALVTFGEIRKSSGDLLEICEGTRCVLVKIVCEEMPFEIRREVIEEDFRAKKKPTRIGIALTNPVQSAQINILIKPVEKTVEEKP